MLSVLMALLVAQLSASVREPWRNDPIVAVPDGRGGYEPPPPKLGPGRHELVVHWPGAASEGDYHRVYPSGAACLRARAAVLDENARRTAAQSADAEARGYKIVVPPSAPYVMCVPLD